MYICVFLCMSLSPFLQTHHSVQCFTYNHYFRDCSILLPQSFKWLHSIPLCKYAIISLTSFLLNIELFFHRPFANTDNAVSGHSCPDTHIMITCATTFVG